MGTTSAPTTRELPLPRDLSLGLAGLALGVLHNVGDHILIDGDADLAAFAAGCVAVAVAFAVLFLFAVPRISGRTDENDPARWALYMTGVAVLSIPTLFWLGVPYAVVASVFSLGWTGWERSSSQGREKEAFAALALAAVLFVLLLIGSVVEATN